MSLALAINLVFANPRAGGVGRYARLLLRGMAAAEPDLRVLAVTGSQTDPDFVAELTARGTRVRRVPVPTSGGPPGTFVAQTLAQWFGPGLAGRAVGADVVHGPANVCPVVGCGAARVVTLHDLIWLQQPGTLEPAAERGLRVQVLRSVGRAHRVITGAEAAKVDLVRLLDLDPDRIDVVPHGVAPAPARSPTAGDEAALRARHRLGTGPVLLCPAQKRAHKNLERLLRAHAALGRADVALALVGGATPYEDELRALATQLGTADRVAFIGWVTDEELEALYAAAAVVVLPSLLEGFGLPVLEAMQRGVPVACSAGHALEEAAGDAAQTFDPLDVAAIAAALARLLEDEARRAELVALGRGRAAQFTWERAAEGTLAVYRRAIAQAGE